MFPHINLRQPIGSVRDLAALGVGAITLFLGFFFSAQAGLLFLAGAWVAQLTWRYPWTTFLILTTVAPFLLILKATVLLGPLTLLKDVVILALLARLVRRETIERFPASLFTAIAALVGWATLAFVFSDAPVVGLLRLRDLLLYIALFPISLQLLAPPERLRTFLRVFLGTGLLVLALGALQWFAYPDGMVLRLDAARQVWIPRLSSVLAHPNHLGGFLLLLVTLGLALALTRVDPRERFVAGALFLTGLVATYATYSRSAWISVALAVSVVLFLWAMRERPWLVTGGVILGVGALAGSLLVAPVRDHLRAYADPTYQSNKTRLDIVAGVLTEVSRRGAVIGEGLGDTAVLLGRTADIELYDVVAADVRGAQLAKARTFVDNAVVKTWIEQGIVGLVLAAWVGVRLLLAAFSVLRRSPAGERQALALACIGIIVGLAALWWFLDVPDMFPLNLYFWIFAGALAASTVSVASEAVRLPSKA